MPVVLEACVHGVHLFIELGSDLLRSVNRVTHCGEHCLRSFLNGVDLCRDKVVYVEAPESPSTILVGFLLDIVPLCGRVTGISLVGSVLSCLVSSL